MTTEPPQQPPADVALPPVNPGQSTPSQSLDRTALPSPFNISTAPLTLVTQGAEALLFRTVFLTPTTPAALKIRPKKPWRHPVLDARLTRQRILAEARVLAKCQRESVPVPAVLALDWERGWMVEEWVGGGTVKAWIKGRGGNGDEAGVAGMLRAVGAVVARLHKAGVVHGDLTTSNMMLRGEAVAEGQSPEIVLIDFGLAMQSVSEEDRAVDLYVLERAFGSTHPKEEGLFAETVLAAYGEGYKGAQKVLRKLEDVRMRGRKKSMLG
ncbi:hypothetical protein MBLNU230_g7104t1 [Neophaeotheca triangularis]